MKTREHREHRPRVEPTSVVSRVANDLWQREGCPPGHELDHWLMAQEVLRHRRQMRPHHSPDDAGEPHVRPTERLVSSM